MHPAGDAPAPTLPQLGWSDWFAAHAAEPLQDRPELAPARVSIEHRGRYQLIGTQGTLLAWGAQGSQYDSDEPEVALARPRVGDWVLYEANSDDPRIAHVLPRRTTLLRRVSRRKVAVQVVATNIDVVGVVASAEAELNLRQIERYLSAVRSGGADAVVILNKVDAVGVAHLADQCARLATATGDTPVLAMSALSGTGMDQLHGCAGFGRTLGLVGASGVGKSSLVNQLCGNLRLSTGAVRDGDHKGRHTTTHRELVVLDGSTGLQGVLLDTPGMRELQPWAVSERDETFDDLNALALGCRWRGCTHRKEDGCKVQDALRAGDIERGRVEGWRKTLARTTPRSAPKRRTKK